MALPDAQVVDQGFASHQRLAGQQVGVDQIVDVDVVANAGAVRRGIVGAEDRHRSYRRDTAPAGPPSSSFPARWPDGRT